LLLLSFFQKINRPTGKSGNKLLLA